MLDALQVVGLLLVVGGTALKFGAAAALIVCGGLLIGVPLIEAHLFRRG